MKEWFAISAAILNGFGYLLYGRQIKNKSSNPNFVSWLLWAFISLVDFLSYERISEDLILSFTFGIDFVACSAITVYLFSIPRKIEFSEWLILLLGIFAIIVWWIFQTAEGANIIICFASATSFYPTIRKVLEDRKNETPASWGIQAAAYFLMLCGTLSSDWEKIELLAPTMLFVLHVGIAILAIKCKHK